MDSAAYISLFDNEDIMKFLNASDKADLFKKCGLSLSPKEVEGFNKIPEFVFQILSLIDNNDIIGNDKALYAYMQAILATSKMTKWTPLFDQCSTTLKTTGGKTSSRSASKSTLI